MFSAVSRSSRQAAGCRLLRSELSMGTFTKSSLLSNRLPWDTFSSKKWIRTTTPNYSITKPQKDHSRAAQDTKGSRSQSDTGVTSPTLDQKTDDELKMSLSKELNSYLSRTPPDVDSALQQFEALEKQLLSPSLDAAEALMNALADTEQYVVLQDVADRILRLEKLENNRMTIINLLLNSLAKGGCWDQLERALITSEIHYRIEPEAATLDAIVANVLESMNDTMADPYALRFLLRAVPVKQLNRISPKYYGPLLALFSKSDCLEHAWEVYCCKTKSSRLVRKNRVILIQLKPPRAPPYESAELIDLLCKRKKLDYVVRVVQDLLHHPVRLAAAIDAERLNRILRFTYEGSTKSTARTALRIWKMTWKVGVQYNNETINLAISFIVKLRHDGMLRKFWENLQLAKYRADVEVLESFFAGFRQIGLQNSALKSLDMLEHVLAERMSANRQMPAPTPLCFESVMELLLKHNEWDKADHLLSRINEHGYRPTTALASMYMEAALQTLNFEKAEKVLLMLLPPSTEPDDTLHQYRRTKALYAMLLQALRNTSTNNEDATNVRNKELNAKYLQMMKDEGFTEDNLY
ncbi:hypothetical protein HDV05_005514 [Chytridiales sp. JEL 0842]|nr:hypothetical protein HDV05_005514 [Chytridiales sp. JEL 0842]